MRTAFPKSAIAPVLWVLGQAQIFQLMVAQYNLVWEECLLVLTIR